VGPFHPLFFVPYLALCAKSEPCMGVLLRQRLCSCTVLFKQPWRARPRLDAMQCDAMQASVRRSASVFAGDQDGPMHNCLLLSLRRARPGCVCTLARLHAVTGQRQRPCQLLDAQLGNPSARTGLGEIWRGEGEGTAVMQLPMCHTSPSSSTTITQPTIFCRRLVRCKRACAQLPRRPSRISRSQQNGGLNLVSCRYVGGA
jgi:hypothetical protein